MLNLIKKSLAFIFKSDEATIENIEQEAECKEYNGYNFIVQNKKIYFRTGKITPTKPGCFVTLWKRNINNITEPYSHLDQIDYLVVYISEKNHHGFFIFSKEIMIQHGILSSSNHEGKRGFRLYQPWCTTESKQASKSQQWQIQHFHSII